MIKRLKLILLVLPLLFLFSCSDIEGLNDYNAVFSFDVIEDKGEHGPIEIGSPTVTGSDVVVPVIHGIHNFPLYIKGKPKFENPVDRIVGIDFADWIKIDIKRDNNNKPLVDEQGNYIFEERKFYVQALSGLPREYTIKIDYVAASDDANIYGEIFFKQLPPNDIVANLATVFNADTSEEGNLVLINVVNPTFPLVLTPKFTIGDGAMLVENGEKSYEFKDATSRFSFDVVAKDGTVKQWMLGVKLLPIVNSNTINIEQSLLSLTNLEKFVVVPESKGFLVEEYSYAASQELSPVPLQVAPRVKGRSVAKVMAAKVLRSANEGYYAADTLKLYVNTFSGNPFPINMWMEIPTPKSVDIIGMDGMLSFSSMGAVNEFYLLDTGNGIARRWVVSLEEYKSSIATVTSMSFTYEASKVKKTITGSPVVAIVLDESKYEIDPVARTIFLHATEVNNANALAVASWTLSIKIAIGVTPGATLVDFEPLYYAGNNAWQQVRKFGVKASDGTVYEWSVVIRDWTGGQPALSEECSLYGATIKEVRPYVVKIDQINPISIDNENKVMTINLNNDDNGYPISVWLDYEISKYASIETQNGGRGPLVFDSTSSVNTVKVVSESGLQNQEWSVKLRPPLKESGTNITSFQINSFSDNRFAAEVIRVDNDNATIDMNFIQVGAFPVVMDIRMGLSYKATSSIVDASGYGKLEFSKIEDKTFTVIAQNGDSRTWTLKVNYLPQFRNYNFEQWSNYYTPTPKGIQGTPYWATANMKVFGVEVYGTTEIDGVPGQGKAAQLKTGSTAGKLASGSLFLGWFDSSDPLGNMNTPTVMTFMGMPFSASRKITGFEVDINYHPGKGAASDGGSLTMELLRQDDTSKPLVYHPASGDGTIHPNNNAVSVASGKEVIAIQAEVLSTGDTPTKVVADGVWEKVFVPLKYIGAYPQYTHISVVFASSSKGDSFKGAEGSVMKIDNVRLVYEE